MRLNNLKGFGHTLNTVTELAPIPEGNDIDAWIETALRKMRSVDHSERMGYVVSYLDRAGNVVAARKKLADFLVNGEFSDEPYSGYWRDFAVACLLESFPDDLSNGRG
jgi:hypothetical protein